MEFGANRGFMGVYAPLIAARIPGKSLKQIREKVRMMRRTGRLPYADLEEEAARFEEESDASPSSASEASEVRTVGSGDESEAYAEGEAAALELGGWESNPRDEWLRSEPRNPLAVEFQGEWTRKERPENIWLEGFVEKVTAACLAMSNDQQGQGAVRNPRREQVRKEEGTRTRRKCSSDAPPVLAIWFEGTTFEA